MVPDRSDGVGFTEFVKASESRLRQALTAAFGPDVGIEAAAEALAYGWEHWDKVAASDNPAGYLYRVGYNQAIRMKRRHVKFPMVDSEREPWLEPGLPDAIAALPEQQRIVVGLLHGYQWTMSEVAAHLGVSKGTVQSHAERGLAKLRSRLGVNV